VKSVYKAIAALLLCALLLAGWPGAAAAAASPEATEELPFYLSGDVIVYVTATGKCYHAVPDCGNTKTAFALSLAEACRIGYTPCGRCDPPAAVPPREPFAFPEGSVIVYVSVGTQCYHRTADCGSLQNAVPVTLEEAVYLGRRPCKECRPPQ